MLRAVLGVIAGFVLWSVLWLGLGAALRGAGMLPSDTHQAVSAAGPLLVLLIGSAVFSLVAGYVAVLIGRRIQGATALGVLLFIVGAAVEGINWRLLPVWYHVLFLVLLIPLAVLGGRLCAGRMAQGA